MLDPENVGYRFYSYERSAWVRIRPRMEPPVDAADVDYPDAWSSERIDWTYRAILWEVMALAEQLSALAEQLSAKDSEIEHLKADARDSIQQRDDAIRELDTARRDLADRDVELGQARGAAGDLLRLLDQEKGRHPDACHWPGCKNPGLCQSGNFGDQVVCGEHFKITNGAGRFWEGYKAGRDRERVEQGGDKQAFNRGFEAGSFLNSATLAENDRLRGELKDAKALAVRTALDRDERLSSSYRGQIEAWLRDLLAEERRRADGAEVERDKHRAHRNEALRDAARYCRDRERAREGHQEAADLAELRLAEIRRLRSEIAAKGCPEQCRELRERIIALRNTVKGERIKARGAERERARFGRLLNEANRRACVKRPSPGADFAELCRLAQRLADETHSPEPAESIAPPTPSWVARSRAVTHQVASVLSEEPSSGGARVFIEDERGESGAATIVVRLGENEFRAPFDWSDPPALIRLRAEGLVKELREAMASSRPPQEKPKETAQSRPPLGAKPDYIWREHRCRDLAAAISRYDFNSDRRGLRLAWCEELLDHLEWLAQHRAPIDPVADTEDCPGGEIDDQVVAKVCEGGGVALHGLSFICGKCGARGPLVEGDDGKMAIPPHAPGGSAL